MHVLTRIEQTLQNLTELFDDPTKLNKAQALALGTVHALLQERFEQEVINYRRQAHDNRHAQR